MWKTSTTFACHLGLPALLSLAFVVASAAQNFTVANLTADVAGVAANTDPNLINPTGIARGINGPWWVANGGTPTSTLYDGNGGLRPLVVNLPPPPGSSTPTIATGMAFSGNSGFNATPGNPALFMFVTFDGTILGWNPNLDPFNAVIMLNRNGKASYTGMTIAEIGTSDYLYVVNALNGSIGVLDHNLNRASLENDAFVDPNLPEGLVPFNVQNIGQDIVITYTRQSSHGGSKGPQGWVAIFSPRGRFLSRLQHGPWLNAPWGVTLAPHDFGEFSHLVLVANHGSGQIAAFDPFTGKFVGVMLDPNGIVISIDGLWALSFADGGIADFGTGPNNGPYNACYFSAGTQMGQHGLFGNLIPVDTEQNRDEQ